MGWCTDRPRRLFLPGWLRLAFMVVGVAAILSGGAAAQEAPCSSHEECLTRALARSWETYAREIEQRWQDLQRARANFQKAEQLGQPVLVAQAQQFLSIAEQRWGYVRAAGQALASPKVSETLRDNLIYNQRSLEMAASVLQRQNDLYKGLKISVGAERDSLAHQLDGLAKDGIRMEREIFFTQLTDSLARPGEWALQAVREPHILKNAFGFADLSAQARFMPLMANVSGGAASVSLLLAHIDRIRNQEPPPANAIEALKPYAEIGQVVMPHLITAAQTAGQATAVFASRAALSLSLVQFAGYALDAARLGQAFSQMNTAQARLDEVLKTDESWQKAIRFHGAKVAKLRAEQTRAEDMLRRQAVIVAALQGKE